MNNGAHGTVGVPIDLAGRVALVTGAGSGIGEAIAGILARAGAVVAVADLSEPAAGRVAGEITAQGGRAIAVRLDVADEASVREGVSSIVAQLGPIRILVNNAATWTIKPFADTSPAEIERVFAVTVTGAMNVTRSVLTDLCAEPGGRVVNIISDSGRVGEGHMAAYASAKAALVGFTKSLAREVGRQGVTVNGVSPGTTLTPGSADFIASVGGEQKLARAYPLGRLGRPDDIAGGRPLLRLSPRGLDHRPGPQRERRLHHGLTLHSDIPLSRASLHLSWTGSAGSAH